MAKMTTIKVNGTTKKMLDRYRRPSETYNAAVARLLKKDSLEQELADAYEDRRKYDKKLIEEWEKIQDGDW